MTSMNDRLDQAAEETRAQFAGVEPVPLDAIRRQARRSLVLSVAASAVVVAGVVTAVGVAASRPGRDGGAPADKVPINSVSVEGAMDDLPLYALQRWPREVRATQSQRKEQLTRECMASKGLEYPSEKRDVDATNLTLVDHPYGFWSESETDGSYEWVDGALPQVSNRVEEYVSTLERDERRRWWWAFMGRGTGTSARIELADGSVVDSAFGDAYLTSCSGAATDAVYGGRFEEYEAYQSRLETYETAAWDSTERDPRMREALEKWSTCMRDRGYDVDHPDALGERFNGDGVQPGETETLDADLACKQEAALAETWFGLKAWHEQQEIDQHPEIVDGFRALKAEVLDGLNERHSD